MTVAELIARLQTFPQDLEVRMSMHMEYEEAIEPHFLYTYKGRYTDKPTVLMRDDAAPRNEMTELEKTK